MLNRLLASPKFARLIPVIALVLCLPSLFTGFLGDDFFFYAIFTGHQAVVPVDDISLFNLFSFSNGDPERLERMMPLGLMPWWTTPEFRYMFFRPLAEISHFIDFSLWPRSSLMMHLHNLVWFGLVLVVLARLYRHWFAMPLGISSLALLLFAVDSSHALTISWIANRNALIAAFFSLLALAAFMRWREQQQGRDFVLALGLFALAMASAEIALSITAYFFAYAICLDKKGPWVGIKSLLPFAAFSLLWLWVYKQQGFGASGVPSFYLDPMADPVLFLQELTQRLPVMLMSQWGIVLAELSQDQNLAQISQLQAQVGLLILALLWLPLAAKDKLMCFFLIAAVISVLPVCAALPQDRNLFFVGFAGSAALARYCQLVWLHKAQWGALRRSLNSLAVGVLLFLHLFVSALLLPVLSYAPAIFSGISIDAAQQAPSSLEGKHLFFVDAPMPVSAYFTPIRYYLGLELPATVQALSFAIGDSSWQPLGERQLALHLEQGLLAQEGKLVRDPRSNALPVGHTVDLNQLSIEVQDAEARKLKLSFKQAITNDDYLFAVWQKQSDNSHKLVYVSGEELLALAKRVSD